MPQLRKLIGGQEFRDAVHVAIVPMTCDRDLRPGEHVSVVGGRIVRDGEPNAVVDPFLNSPVKSGETFWLCLYPNTVTSLRHDWIHPAFGTEESRSVEKQESEKWLREYAARMSPYRTPEAAFSLLIEGLMDKSLFAHGTDLHALYDLESADDLRFHAEHYLGMRINWDEFGFSCSC